MSFKIVRFANSVLPGAVVKIVHCLNKVHNVHGVHKVLVTRQNLSEQRPEQNEIRLFLKEIGGFVSQFASFAFSESGFAPSLNIESSREIWDSVV
jgi:hypothetical protein